jgi:hypothetical protein
MGLYGCELMAIGFKTTYAISAHQRYSCVFKSRSIEVYSIQHYVIKFVSDLRQDGGFLRVLQFPPLIKLTATI